MRQLKQLETVVTHVRQGDEQATQILFNPINPVGQVSTHKFPDKYFVLQLVHVVVVPVQV